jgi:hypothetical protein
MKNDNVKADSNAFEKIAEGVVYGNLGLFVGAGLPMAIMNGHGESVALSWPQLLEKCADHFEINFKALNVAGNSYPQIASKLCSAIAKKKKLSKESASVELKQLISDLTSLYPDTKAREKFSRIFEILEPKWIITTNYDTVIESLLTGVGHSLSPEDQLLAPAGRIPVYHLHGIRTNPNSIVITQEDYVSLFRPNQYRQQKLPLTIKESVTLLIGYGLGDFNVLTALDWSKNVFESSGSSAYPNHMIQLIRSDKPKLEHYDRDGISVIEFQDLSKCLANICDYVDERKLDAEKAAKKLRRLETKYADPTEEMINSFLEDNETRNSILSHLKENKHYYINGFLELLSRSLDRVWAKARKSGQFHQYDNYLDILFDIIENIDFDTSPPALVQIVCYGLDKVGNYVGPGYGEAHAAHQTWLKRGTRLPPKTIKELKNISKLNPTYYNLERLLAKLGKDVQ